MYFNTNHENMELELGAVGIKLLLKLSFLTQITRALISRGQHAYASSCSHCNASSDCSPSAYSNY